MSEIYFITGSYTQWLKFKQKFLPRVTVMGDDCPAASIGRKLFPSTCGQTFFISNKEVERVLHLVRSPKGLDVALLRKVQEGLSDVEVTEDGIPVSVLLEVLKKACKQVNPDYILDSFKKNYASGQAACVAYLGTDAGVWQYRQQATHIHFGEGECIYPFPEPDFVVSTLA